jgi:hypothetical protein
VACAISPVAYAGPDAASSGRRPLASLEYEHTNRRVSTVEVKIGVTDSPRELILASAQTPAEVEKLVTDALSGDPSVLALTDEKGRRFLVQSTRIAYVEIGAADSRRVGFGVVGAEVAKG